MSLIEKKCLILNKSWYPTDLATVFKVTNMVLLGRAKFLHPQTLQPYDFWEWVDKGVEYQETIRTPQLAFDIPEIVITTRYNVVSQKKIALNSHNIFKRDSYRCAYCGSNQNLTIDHVIPRSKGGKDSWRNLVTACADCNSHKSDNDVAEFCKRKGCVVPQPTNPGTQHWLFKHNGDLPESWKQFLIA